MTRIGGSSQVLREDQANRAGFPRVHAAPDDPTGIDDRRSVALVILPPAAAHDPGAGVRSRAAEVVGETIERRGSGQRRYRNSLTFVAADTSNVEAARENARRERAWQSILDDADLRQNLTLAQTNDAEAQARRSRDALRQSVRGAWVHVLHPGPSDAAATEGAAVGRGYVIACYPDREPGRWQECARGGVGQGEHRRHRIRRDRTGQPDAEPRSHLAYRTRPHLSIDDIRDWFASYVYLPRLRDEATLDGALQRLVENLADPFAYASGFDEEIRRV